jgi:hypothetical protein
MRADRADEATGAVLLQGGHWVAGDRGDFLADTWQFDGTDWTEVTARGGPGARVNAPGTWSDVHGAVVMFGGGTGPDTPMSTETWRWGDGAWSRITTTTAPGPRGGHAMAYDEARGVVVLVGGIDRPGGRQSLDVWELGANGWREAWPAG